MVDLPASNPRQRPVTPEAKPQGHRRNVGYAPAMQSRLGTRFSSLRWKLAAVFVALALPPLVIAAGYLYYELPRSLEHDARVELSADQRAAASGFERHIAGVEADTSILADLPAVRRYAASSDAALASDVEADFLLFAGAHANYLQVRYIDQAGQERVRIDRRDGALIPLPEAGLQDKSGRYYVEAASALAPGEIYVSPLDLNRERGGIQEPHVPVIRFAAPVANEDGAPAGFVIVNLDASTLVEELRATGGADTDTDLMLVDGEGFYLVHPDPARSWSGPRDLDTGWNLFEEVPDFAALASSATPPTVAQLELRASDQQLVAGEVGPPDRGWLLVASAPESAILAPARTLRIQLLLVFGAMTAVGLGVIWFATGRLSRPARLLREGAVQIGRGDFQHRIDLPSSDELGDVAHAFDQMAEQLEDSYRTLEGRVAERTHDLQDRDRKLRGLNEIGMGLVTAGAVDEIATRAADYARRLTDADHAVVTFEDRDGPVAHGHLTRADRIPEGAHRLSDPISGGGSQLGEIQVARSPDRPDFQAVDRELLETLANQVGVAIENANLHARERETVTRLEELNQAKTDFVSTVSHQLRSPVAALRGYTEIINAHGDTIDDTQRARILQVIAAETEHLTELVEDVLRVSRIDAGRLVPESRPALLGPLIDEVVEEVGRVDQNAHPILLERGEPALVVADPMLLKQALLNLVDNAAKYSPPGGRVHVTWTADPAAEVAIVIVEDEGPGIPESDHDRVFERFVRLPAPDGEAGPSGTGLGLYIARSVIEAHGGSIQVDRGAVGARFTTRLPLAPVGAERSVSPLPQATA